jgi:hypothetical protein
MDPSTAPRILGVHLSPLGVFSHQINVCKDKADGFAAKLLSPKITASDARFFHRSIYTPSLRYPLAALADDEEALASIQTKIIPAILQKLHINKNLPTSIRHGPTTFGGMELFDVRTEAGIESIKYMRNAVHSQSKAGKLILINVNTRKWKLASQHPSSNPPTFTSRI